MTDVHCAHAYVEFVEPRTFDLGPVVRCLSCRDLLELDTDTLVSEYEVPVHVARRKLAWWPCPNSSAAR